MRQKAPHVFKMVSAARGTIERHFGKLFVKVNAPEWFAKDIQPNS